MLTHVKKKHKKNNLNKRIATCFYFSAELFLPLLIVQSWICSVQMSVDTQDREKFVKMWQNDFLQENNTLIL